MGATMRSSFVSVSVVAVVAVALSFLCGHQQPFGRAVSPTANVEDTKMLGRLPVAFVPNVGQWEHPARYVAKVGPMTVFLEEKGWTFTLVERAARRRKECTESIGENAFARGVAVRMTFAGAREPELIGEDQLPGRHNYFLRNDPSRWRSDVPLYGAVRYQGLHPGVDVRAPEHDRHCE